MEILDTLRELTLCSAAFRLLLSIFMGGVLGIERGLRNRPAGFLTYVLVSLSATIVMLTNQYISLIEPYADPTRLAAQIVSGIGFLGAGAIMVTHNDEIRGLNTAAGLWMAAGLGLAVGVGFYEGAVLGFIACMFTLLVLKRVDTYIRRHAINMDVYLEYNSNFSLRALSQFMDENHFTMYDMRRGRIRTLSSSLGTMAFTIETTHQIDHQHILDGIYHIPGVEYIREIG